MFLGYNYIGGHFAESRADIRTENATFPISTRLEINSAVVSAMRSSWGANYSTSKLEEFLILLYSNFSDVVDVSMNYMVLVEHMLNMSLQNS